MPNSYIRHVWRKVKRAAREAVIPAQVWITKHTKPFVHYRRPGGVWIGEYAHDMADAQRQAERMRRQGYQVRISKHGKG